MSVLEAIILGIIQGLAEFLPVSSSGHLVLCQKIFGIEGANVLSFDIALHLATLVAVCTVYYKKLWEMIKKPFSKLPMFLVLGTIPIGIFGLLFKDSIEGFFKTGETLGYGFLFTGIILLVSEKMASGKKNIKEMKPTDAFLVGTAQAVAMLPAVSRSGMTISGGLFAGLDRKFAADYSFLLSIPAILAATLNDILSTGDVAEVAGSTIGFPQYLFGMFAAAFSGYFAVRIMIKLITDKKLKYFSIYVGILGVLVLLDQFVLHIVFKL